MRRPKQKQPQPTQVPAGGGGTGGGQAEQSPAWSPPGASTTRGRGRPSLRATNKNPTRTSGRITSYPDPGAGYRGDPNLKGAPKTSSYPKTAGNVGHRGYQAIN